MDEAEESKKEDTSYIVPRFNTLYNLAMEQMKFKDIARLQRVSLSTTHGRYRYGLDKLRSLLNSEVQE